LVFRGFYLTAGHRKPWAGEPGPLLCSG
jgi:hypothetical protein